jgi:hypothetical protein
MRSLSFICMRVVSLSLIIFGLLNNAWSAPINFQVSKDFRGLIVEGERPEIVACMAATRRLIKNSTEYEDFRWPNNPSQSAILNEKENNGQLNRTVTMRAQVLPNVEAVFESWLPVEVRCQQVNEGYPKVTITILNGAQ